MMGDLKSKLPDLKELGSITSKLFKDLKTSVTEIISEYKQKRELAEDDHTKVEPAKVKPVTVKPSTVTARSADAKPKKEAATKVEKPAVVEKKAKPEAKPIAEPRVETMVVQEETLISIEPPEQPPKE